MLWDRKEVKSKAKIAYKGNHGASIGVVVLVPIMGLIVTALGNIISGVITPRDYFGRVNGIWTLLPMVISFLCAVFITNIIMIGKNKFFIMTQRNEVPGVGMIFDGFSSQNYLNIAESMLFLHLFLVLWYFAIAIPTFLVYLFISHLLPISFSYGNGMGILITVMILAMICLYIVIVLKYSMVPYIIADNLEMKWDDAIRMSKEMMNGRKKDFFVLVYLSFLGWIALGLLIALLVSFLGMPLLTVVVAIAYFVCFVDPYIESTAAQAYEFLKQEAYEKKIVQ